MTPKPPTESAPPLLLLAGPTATGKTALAVEAARRLDAEIISADSMQVYRGCAVGTAQPTRSELRGVVCHLAGCVEPFEAWTVADWLRATRQRIAEARERGRAVVVAGGTGLYFKALTEGLFEAPGAERNPQLRSELEARWDADGGEGLWAELGAADPKSAARLHRNDRVRIVRALEVYLSTGKTIGVLQSEGRRAHRPLPAIRFVLSAGRRDLYERIDQRVVEMVANGFVEEVRALLDRGALESWPAMRALGYPQMLRAIRGEMNLEEAVEETQRLSRRYAKQQAVLFRNWPSALWLDVSRGAEKTADIVEIMLEFYRNG